MKIGLLRHGRTEWNEAGRLQGRTDIPISDAERTRLSTVSLPPEWQGAAILSSPLSRARETADIIAEGPITTDDALIELDLGAWEGKRGVDLLGDPSSGYRHVEEWGWDGRPPGGETPRELLARVDPLLSGLTEDTVIVSHINIMRVILAKAHDWHFDGPMPFRIKRNRLYILHREGNIWRAEPEPVRLVSRCA